MASNGHKGPFQAIFGGTAEQLAEKLCAMRTASAVPAPGDD